MLPTLTVLYVIEALWLIFTLYWFIKSFGNKKTTYRQPLGQRLLYLIPAVFIYYLLKNAPQLKIPFFPESLPIQLLGILLTVAGLAFAIYARVILAKNWSAIVTLKQDHELIQSGPYSFVRHPIYTGITFAAIGTLLALIPSPAALIALALIIAGLTFKLRLEEKLMLQQFPEAYPAYKKKVKTAFLPLIY